MSAVLALALVIEVAAGYPAILLRAIGHPVMWFGALIGGLDRLLNRDTAAEAARRTAGVLALLIILSVAIALGIAIQMLAAHVPPVVAILGLAIVASSGLAARSLHEHVGAVADALDAGGLDAGRRAVAPAFWLALAGLPGIAAYKAINTADSMIGHRTPRHRAFGWASARLDDLVNLPASRLTALLLILAAALMPSYDARSGWRAVWRDARHHRSPNAGWPEAAMAGALGLRLAGPRVYCGMRVEDQWMGDGRSDATANDVRRALRLFRVAHGLTIAACVAVAFGMALA